MRQFERKKEIIDVCLSIFIKKGLTHTRTRDLCDALNMNSGGVFYYFKTKDEIILACTEEAAKRMERDLLDAALGSIEDPKKMIEKLWERSTALQPLMKFFVSVCACTKYEHAIQPILDQLTRRYHQYAQKFAEVFCCECEEIEPYVYITINTMFNYMMFGQKSYTESQLNLIYKVEMALLERRNQTKTDEQ